MPQNRNHEERLEELVQEAISILKENKLLRGDSKALEVTINSPWFQYNGRIHQLLFDRTPETRAAIVYTASRTLRDELDSIAVYGEALHHAAEIRGNEFSQKVLGEFDSLWNKIWNSGYRQIFTHEIVKEQLGKNAHYSRSMPLREQLEAKAETIQGARIFYTRYGSGVYVRRQILESSMQMLREFADEIIPENIERKGFIELSAYIQKQVGNEQGADLLSAWIEEAINSGNIVIRKSTIDGEKTYIPPTSVRRADSIAMDVKNARVPQYIVRNCYKSVEEFLGEQVSGEKGMDVLRKWLYARLEENGLIKARETTEGAIEYIPPSSVMIASKTAETLKSEVVPRYIEERGYARLNNLVGEYVESTNQRKARKLIESVQKSSQMQSWLEDIETVEGNILYVHPGGISDVKQFIEEKLYHKPFIFSLFARIFGSQTTRKLPEYTVILPEYTVVELEEKVYYGSDGEVISPKQESVSGLEETVTIKPAVTVKEEPKHEIYAHLDDLEISLKAMLGGTNRSRRKSRQEVPMAAESIRGYYGNIPLDVGHDATKELGRIIRDNRNAIKLLDEAVLDKVTELHKDYVGTYGSLADKTWYNIVRLVRG